MEAGRPKKGLEVLPEDWQKEVIDLYSQGASDVEIKAHLRACIGSFSNDLWERWIEEEPIFSETIKSGKLISQAWWERKGRISLENKDFNYSGWYMNMKNRFKWKDRQDITSDDDPIKQVNVIFEDYSDD
jgi:hypothetical protein